jgi:hypothetical protein
MKTGTVETNPAKHAIHDKLESQIKTAEAKLDTLKSRAETAKATAQVKAIAALTAQRLEIHQKLQELKTSSEDRWEHAKTDLETKVAAFEKAVKEIEAKVKAH